MRHYGEYFSVTDDKMVEIEAAFGTTIKAGSMIFDEMLSRPWARGDNYQTWLDTAPAAEIVRQIADQMVAF